MGAPSLAQSQLPSRPDLSSQESNVGLHPPSDHPIPMKALPCPVLHTPLHRAGDQRSKRPVREMSKDLSSDKRNLSGDSRSYISWDELDGGGQAHAGGIQDYSSLNDQELLILIAQHSRDALSALYDRYAGAVYSLAARKLQDAGAAEEVTQDTFFNIWRRASSYRPERGKVTAWLFSIGHNRIIDELRRRRRRQEKLVYQDVSLLNQSADEHGDPTLYAARRCSGARLWRP